MQGFVGRHGTSHCRLRAENGTTWLEPSEPAVVASFVSYCRGPGNEGRRVYLRGQTSPPTEMLPSLFRDCDGHPSRRASFGAYRAFVQRLPEKVTGNRFTRQNFGAVLQHYGFRTPWLDVLDDVHAAIWFALHARRLIKGQVEYQRTSCDAGWLLLLSVPPPPEVECQDLRETQSSRNVRCHVQQGYSLAMQLDDGDPAPQQDFAPMVVGRVRVPNDERWHLRGFRASQGYLFPGETVDDTYRQLLSPAIVRLAERVERQHGLEVGTLGRASRYRVRTGKKRCPAGG